MVRGRLQETHGSWWFRVELPVYALAEVRGRFTAEPSPVVFTASGWSLNKTRDRVRSRRNRHEAVQLPNDAGDTDHPHSAT